MLKGTAVAIADNTAVPAHVVFGAVYVFAGADGVAGRLCMEKSPELLVEVSG